MTRMQDKAMQTTSIILALFISMPVAATPMLKENKISVAQSARTQKIIKLNPEKQMKMALKNNAKAWSNTKNQKEIDGFKSMSKQNMNKFKDMKYPF